MTAGIFLLLSALLLVGAAAVFRGCVRRDYACDGKLGWLGVALETSIFFLYMNLSYAFIPAPWLTLPALPGDACLRLPGLALIGGGLALVVAGMGQIGLARALGTPAKGLYQSGLYRLVRNPQIAGGGLIVVGCALLWPSWRAAVWALLYGPLAHLMVTTEEEHLLAVFDDAFRDYCASVPRYVPRLRGR